LFYAFGRKLIVILRLNFTLFAQWGHSTAKGKERQRRMATEGQPVGAEIGEQRCRLSWGYWEHPPILPIAMTPLYQIGNVRASFF